MKREEKILQHINKNGIGIEIGPSHRPIASKNEGYNVHVIDHMSREQLIKKYKNHGVDLDKIEEVDFVWHGESYRELTGKYKYYDWIIASHVIEHTPDLIGFLNDCDEILKDDGVISLVVPDKRYCFDHYRPITGISRIIDSHFHTSNINTPGTVAEYFLNVVSKSGKIAWDSKTIGEYSFVHSVEDTLRGMKSVMDENAYMDVHSWCFVPHSFRLMIQDLFSLGLISAKELSFYPTTGSEFYITLGRSGQGVNKPRLELLEIIETELKKDEADIKEQFRIKNPEINKIIKRLTSRALDWWDSHR